MELVDPQSPPSDGAPLSLKELRRAVDLYLGIAYPEGEIPESVRRRLDWPQDSTLADLLSRPPFEKVGQGKNDAPIVALRLGNRRYPHMKLQIQPWDTPEAYLLSVNTHDQILSLDTGSNEAPAIKALQEENQRIKEAIEHGWDEGGLPTFVGFLRGYLAAQANPTEPIA